MTQTRGTESGVLPPAAPARGLSWRSFGLGLLLVVLIAVLTPLNDYVRRNTFLIGGQLPLTLVFVITMLAAVVNPVLALFADGRPAGRRAAWGLLALAALLLGLAGTIGALWGAAHLFDSYAATTAWQAWSRAWPQTDLTVLAVACALVGALVAYVNPLANRHMRTGRLRLEELALAVAMMLMACAVPSSGLLGLAMGQPAQAVYFAPQYPWFNHYLGLLPQSLFPSRNPTSPTIMDFYLGINPRSGSTLWGSWGPWLLPYLVWGIFIGAMFTAAIFLVALFRRQWAEHERLSFPLATIPLELMAAPQTGLWTDLWRNRLLWVGAAVPIFWHLLNGLQMYYPNMPAPPLGYNFTSSFTEFPWSALDPNIKSASVFFSMLGVAYFVPLEILFSIWFFYLAYQVGSVLVIATGTPVLAANRTYQANGFAFTYGVFFLWISRHHLRRILQAAWRGTPREPDEVVSYRTGLLVFCAAVAVATGWLMWVTSSQTAGMGWLWSFLWALTMVLLLVYFMLLLTRLAIEAGLPFVYLPYGADPIGFFTMLFRGTGQLTQSQWLMNTWGSWLILSDQRENIMPFAADALRVGGVTPPKARRRFFGALLLAVLLALVLGQMTHHLIAYSYGRNTYDDWRKRNSTVYVVMGQARTLAESQDTGTVDPGRNFLYGALLMGAVGLSRLMFTGSPFHPIGLLVINSGAINMWFSIMVAWAIKAALLRFGGAKAYRALRPVFIGLIVGDALIAVLWIIVGYIVQRPDAATTFTY